MDKVSLSQGEIPMVRASILAPVIKAVEKLGLEPGPILEPYDLTAEMLSDPKSFTRSEVVFQVFEQAAVLAGRQDFSVSVGEQIDLTKFIPFGTLLEESTTLGGFITRFTQAVAKDSTSVYQSLLVEDDLAYFSARRTFEPEAAPAQMDGFMVGIWISYLHKVTDFRWDPTQVIVQICDPDVLPEHFHGIKAIKTNWLGFSIRFPAAWLAFPINMGSSRQNQQTIRMNPELFAPSGFLNTVEASILPHVLDQDFDAGKAAKVCGFTKPALARRLAKHDTSISELITNMRMKYAQTALSGTSDSVEQIAFKIGYLDPNAFTRAFKSWFGKTPTEFRNENRTYLVNDLE